MKIIFRIILVLVTGVGQSKGAEIFTLVMIRYEMRDMMMKSLDKIPNDQTTHILITKSHLP